MGWEWEYGHGNVREWDRKIHSRTSLVRTKSKVTISVPGRSIQCGASGTISKNKVIDRVIKITFGT